MATRCAFVNLGHDNKYGMCVRAGVVETPALKGRLLPTRGARLHGGRLVLLSATWHLSRRSRLRICATDPSLITGPGSASSPCCITLGDATLRSVQRVEASALVTQKQRTSLVAKLLPKLAWAKDTLELVK